MESLNDMSFFDGIGKFRSTLLGIRNNFFTLEEFPFLDRTQLPMNVLDEAMNIRTADLEEYAFGLSGKALEGLLLDLIHVVDPDRIDQAVRILKIRFSPRLVKLLTMLYQFYETSEGLNECLREYNAILSHRAARTPAELFIKQVGNLPDKFEAICDAIDEMRWDIAGTLKEYAIYTKSPFAGNCVLMYLSRASKPALLLNRSWIIKCLQDQPTPKLTRLIENYLSTFNLKDYHDGINLAIEHKLGHPYSSTDWEFYPTELKHRFAQWAFLHQLKLHTIEVPKKYMILSKYVDQVRDSYKIEEENLFVIDFGEIIIADIEDRPYSFFYQRDAFEAEMRAWRIDKEQLPTFIRIDKRNLTARDFIIEEVEEPCVKLSYEGIDILYIHEMLDIKMGLEPDMRRKQLAKTMRKDSLHKRPQHLE